MVLPQLKSSRNISNSLNFTLWLTCLIAPPSFYLASLTQGMISIGVFTIGALLVLTFIVKYLFILFKHPEDLRKTYEWE